MRHTNHDVTRLPDSPFIPDQLPARFLHYQIRDSPCGAIIRAMVPSFVRVSAAAAVALALAVVSLPGATVPTPTVTGPLPATAPGDPGRDYPFFASVVDLKANGWVEEEFFIEGTANRYNTPPLATATIVDSSHPYKTRIVVRRPATAARFNGTVIVEWNNVTAGRDLDIDWFQTNEHLLRSGYAWVGVTPQVVGVEALKVWSAKRYGTLDVTHGGTVARDDSVVRHLRAGRAGDQESGPGQRHGRAARPADVRDRALAVGGPSRHVRQFGSSARQGIRRRHPARWRQPGAHRSGHPGVEAAG